MQATEFYTRPEEPAAGYAGFFGSRQGQETSWPATMIHQTSKTMILMQSTMLPKEQQRRASEDQTYLGKLCSVTHDVLIGGHQDIELQGRHLLGELARPLILLTHIVDAPHAGQPLIQLRLPVHHDSIGDDNEMGPIVVLVFHQISQQCHHLQHQSSWHAKFTTTRQSESSIPASSAPQGGLAGFILCGQSCVWQRKMSQTSLSRESRLLKQDSAMFAFTCKTDQIHKMRPGIDMQAVLQHLTRRNVAHQKAAQQAGTGMRPCTKEGHPPQFHGVSTSHPWLSPGTQGHL